MLQGVTVFYGGSFNPPHLAHQMALLYLLEGLGAPEVWMAPAFVHPFGKPLLAFDHRLAMCELAARPLGERVKVSDVERTVGGRGFTVDTLTHLRTCFPERRFALAFGTDVVAELPKWHRWADIQAMAQVLIIGRAGSNADAPLALPNLSSSEVRARLGRGESVQGLVPESVAAYIDTHQLYR